MYAYFVLKVFLVSIYLDDIILLYIFETGLDFKHSLLSATYCGIFLKSIISNCVTYLEIVLNF